MKECYLYRQLPDQVVECQTCAHLCKIAEGKRGICGVRQNYQGKLYLIVYGKAVACHVDPIEKKPLARFMPHTQTLSLATVGCNFRCDNCQNWQISQISKQNYNINEMGEELPPEMVMELAIKYQCPSLSYTYTEPTIFLEYALDIMKLAKKNLLKNIWVSNGYMSDKTLDLIIPYLDAANVDLKSFSDKFYQKHCGASLGVVLKNLKKLKRAGVWLEVTTLLIPKLSDTENGLKSIAQFIFHELGSDTPWHVSAFSPEISWKLKETPATTYEQVKKAAEIGRKNGLKYVYMGNVL
jgi:pyruvate formate lyase activating enzyme